MTGANARAQCNVLSGRGQLHDFVRQRLQRYKERKNQERMRMWHHYLGLNIIETQKFVNIYSLFFISS